MFLTRRWALFALAVLAAAWVAWRLGEWQFDRLDERRTDNAVVGRNLERSPAPVQEVLAVGRPVRPADEWRLVTATGVYDDDATVVLRYQTRRGASGVDLVTPLVTSEGPALLVDRGWVATDNRGTERPDVPPAPTGTVTVTGWVRADAEGDATAVADQSTRAVSSVAIAQTLDYPVYGGFVDAKTEDPPPPEAQTPARTEPPDLSQGPHFFYGLQWWFFGLLALGGFAYLAYDERRSSRRERTAAGRPAGERVVSR